MGAVAVIPPRSDREILRARDADSRGERDHVERALGEFERFGKVAARHDKAARSLMALLDLAAIHLRLE